MLHQAYFLKFQRYLDRLESSSSPIPPSVPLTSSTSRQQHTTNSTTTHIHYYEPQDPWFMRCRYHSCWGWSDPFWMASWSPWTPSPVTQVNHYHTTVQSGGAGVSGAGVSGAGVSGAGVSGSVNDRNSDQDEREKKDKSQLTTGVILGGLVFAGCALGSAYYLFNNWLDYCEEKYLLKNLRQFRRSHATLYAMGRPVLETHVTHSRRMILYKGIVVASGLFMLGDWLWWNHVPSFYAALATGTTGLFCCLAQQLVYRRRNLGTEVAQLQSEIRKVLQPTTPPVPPSAPVSSSAPKNEFDAEQHQTNPVTVEDDSEEFF